MKEIWKDIKGYDGYYQISNLGRVKSLERIICINNTNRKLKDKILTPRYDKKGYLGVALNKNAIARYFKIHRLVANNFINNADNKKQINHKDGNKQNNKVENLEWVTNIENRKHAVDNNLIFQKEVIKYDINNKFLNKFKSGVEAQKITGISRKCISLCCLGKRKTAGGFIWGFANE